jgi:hypothetical protein
MLQNDSHSNESNFDYFLEFNVTAGEYDRLVYYLKLVPSVTIYSLIFFLGFFGNLLVIFAIFYLKKLQSITNMFLVSLASADLLLIIFCVPVRVNIIEFNFALGKLNNFAHYFCQS